MLPTKTFYSAIIKIRLKDINNELSRFWWGL